MRAGWLALIAVAACRPPAPCAGAPLVPLFEDADGDGAGDPATVAVGCAAELPDRVSSGGDCDDTRADVRPGGAEACDGRDNDCDGAIDEATPAQDSFLDADGDGFGDPATRERTCLPRAGAIPQGGDCDDGDPDVNPGAVEVCGGGDEDCDGFADDADGSLDLTSATAWFPDADLDGYGATGGVSLTSCVAPAGYAAGDEDCRDDDPWVNPAALETCDGQDNDCDGLFDDDDPSLQPGAQGLWFTDADGDGLGAPGTGLWACLAPVGTVGNALDCDDLDPAVRDSASTVWLLDGDGDGVGAGIPSGPGCQAPTAAHVVAQPVGPDCDDADPAISPLALEVCGGGDEDCDGLVDDDDPDRDPASAPAWHPDADGDGWGGPEVRSCAAPPVAVSVGGDCDDADPAVSPGAVEVCARGLDDDCDGLVDDLDPSLDPSDGLLHHLDVDRDGFGRPNTAMLGCAVPPGRADNAEDCDDDDDGLGPPTGWWRDGDGDGFGTGTPTAAACAPEAFDQVPASRGEDCDDDEPTVSPAGEEVCDDGVDQDCDGVDRYCPRPTCLDWLTDGLSSGDGVYAIDPSGGGPVDVWCDMTADGGGWTLVSSSFDPVDDQATGYSPLLATLAPDAAMDGIWDGLREVVDPYGDIRFACSIDPLSAGNRVDLVFYEIHWYLELTSGTDEEVCFNEDDGAGYDQPAPRRKNLLTGAVRARGNDWGSGYLEGEDVCASRDDFTVDFDDRGMDSNQFDGTEWGEDDDLVKCGVTNAGAAWYVFIR